MKNKKVFITDKIDLEFMLSSDAMRGIENNLLEQRTHNYLIKFYGYEIKYPNIIVKGVRLNYCSLVIDIVNEYVTG